MASDTESDAADRKVIQTAAALRAVLLEEQKARAAEHAKEQEVRRKERTRDRVERLVTMVTVILLLFVAIGNRGVVEQTRDTAREVRDCTTPTAPSDCSRRTAEAQAKVLEKLREDTVTAAVAGAVCAQRHQTTADAVRACVEGFYPPPSAP